MRGDFVFANTVSWMFYTTLTLSAISFFLSGFMTETLTHYSLLLLTATPLVALTLSLPYDDGKVRVLKVIVIAELLIAFCKSFCVFQ